MGCSQQQIITQQSKTQQARQYRETALAKTNAGTWLAGMWGNAWGRYEGEWTDGKHYVKGKIAGSELKHARLYSDLLLVSN